MEWHKKYEIDDFCRFDEVAFTFLKMCCSKLYYYSLTSVKIVLVLLICICVPKTGIYLAGYRPTPIEASVSLREFRLDNFSVYFWVFMFFFN